MIVRSLCLCGVANERTPTPIKEHLLISYHIDSILITGLEMTITLCKQTHTNHPIIYLRVGFGAVAGLLCRDLQSRRLE